MTVLCHRCDRSFRTYSALYQHERDSSNHHECPVCDYDGTSWEDLLEHCREEGCRDVCGGCNNGQGTLWAEDCDEYWEHVEDYNVCTECERHFSSASNLYQHKLSHRQLMYECYCCDRTFKTYGGMIIHLERGTCGDTDEISMNELAAECRKWRYFIYTNFQNDMYNCVPLEHGLDPYYCPTCDASMPKLSSLFQHIESDSCDQTLGDSVIGQLRNYLASRL
ncbi:hypothetical protein EK21DRAFT_93777 [Setomelanomma holmii]|uniref:C2H2-type domain-containing protein n=1 Tax=Setomelanomma holmii TaxID=210430 RepID=A0A9P4LFS1_9PLEO|nr:hypothetical protein EK21DRAFT_93777 [Setomelanomma holmii]